MHALNNFSSSIDKVSFKKNSMSLGLVVLEKKLFTQTRTRTPTPQSDDIKIKKVKMIISMKCISVNDFVVKLFIYSLMQKYMRYVKI